MANHETVRIYREEAQRINQKRKRGELQGAEEVEAECYMETTRTKAIEDALEAITTAISFNYLYKRHVAEGNAIRYPHPKYSRGMASQTPEELIDDHLIEAEKHLREAIFLAFPQPRMDETFFDPFEDDPTHPDARWSP